MALSQPIAPQRSRLLTIGVYASTVILSLLLAAYALQLWRADLRIPFSYGYGDELTAAMGAKWLTEEPWVMFESRLAAPGTADMSSWPQPDVLWYAVVKILAVTTRNFGLVVNLFHLLTFPATAVAALYVLRRFGISFPAAMFASLLYACLPYHFMRGLPHLFLGAYAMVPLLVFVLFRVASHQPPFTAPRADRWPSLSWRGRDSWLATVVCVVAGAGGAYYAFFACCLLGVVGLVATLAHRKLTHLLSAAIAVVLLVGTGAACVLPNIIHGERRLAERRPDEAETYALKITHLLLPVSGHRLRQWAALKSRYYQSAPLNNENDAATLGVTGSVGFLILLAYAGMRLVSGDLPWLDQRDRHTIGTAALINIAATLIGTVGGIGALIAYLVYPQIRAYNRISVFIAFVCLLAVALLIDRFIGRRLRSRPSQVIFAGALAGVFALAFLDQTARQFVPPYADIRTRFRSDASFVRTIENTLPPGAMVFQLPYFVFPYASRYDHAKGFLHSRSLRWSYGAMQESATDLWQRAVSNKPTPELVRELVKAGFAGIYIDRNLYGADAQRVERDLATNLEIEPIVSANRDLAFFRLPQPPR